MKHYIKLLFIITYEDGTVENLICEYDEQNTYEFDEFTIVAHKPTHTPKDNINEVFEELKSERPHIVKISVYQWYDGIAWEEE